MDWASLGAGDKRTDDGPDHTIFVDDLVADVTDYVLQETFKEVYSSVSVTDRTTGRSKGYGFVKFGDEREQMRAMTEMNGVLCSTRPMRIGLAADKKTISSPTQRGKKCILCSLNWQNGPKRPIRNWWKSWISTCIRHPWKTANFRHTHVE